MTEQDWKHKCQQIMISVLEELGSLQTRSNLNVCICGLFPCVLNVLHLLCSDWSLQLSSSTVGGPKGHLGTVPKYALKEASRVSSS